MIENLELSADIIVSYCISLSLTASIYLVVDIWCMHTCYLSIIEFQELKQSNC